jgi:hypothetical protein
VDVEEEAEEDAGCVSFYRICVEQLISLLWSGFARRYFTLYESGVLEYAFEPHKPARDHLLMQSAAISSSPGHKDIHLDASNATFHVKCLTMEDFQMWMTALRYVTFLCVRYNPTV